MKERIQKVLANYGVDSRRNIELMISQGRVAVNGDVVTKLPVLIDPEVDHVTVDDEVVRLAKTRKGKAPVEKMYFLLNKPKRVYSTNVAQGEQRLAKDLLPADLPGRVYPVGRLDADSKGLLLLTNDGDLTNLLTHPRYEVPKTYRAEVDGMITDETVQTLENGIWLADKDGKGFKTGKCRIKSIFRGKDESIVEITIKEGRNRQVRRMLAKFGHKVRELTRIRMGPLTLEGVGSGKFRPLTSREVKQLFELARDGEKRSNEKRLAEGKPVASPVKKSGRTRPPARQADVSKDLAVQFEDEELRREAAAEAGEDVTTPTTPAAAKAAKGAAVEFVDVSEDEIREMEEEARQAVGGGRAEANDDDEPEIDEEEDEDEDNELPE